MKHLFFNIKIIPKYPDSISDLPTYLTLTLANNKTALLKVLTGTLVTACGVQSPVTPTVVPFKATFVFTQTLLVVVWAVSTKYGHVSWMTKLPYISQSEMF